MDDTPHPPVWISHQLLAELDALAALMDRSYAQITEGERPWPTSRVSAIRYAVKRARRELELELERAPAPTPAGA